MAKLYELAEQYLALTRVIDEGGVSEEDFKQALDQLKDNFEDKVENIGKMALSCSSDAQSIEAEIGRLSARQRVLTTAYTHLKSYLLLEMSAVGVDKVQRPLVTVSLRKSPPSCEVYDDALIPENFWRVIPETKEIDKRAILDRFRETAEVVDGVSIITDRKHVQIR